MPAAANFNEAAFFASQNVQGKFQTSALVGSLTAWLSAIEEAMNTPAGAGNQKAITQRTVYNLIPIGRDLLNKITNNQFSANEISVYLNRCCRGIQFAQLGGRISSAQTVALLAKYNLIWV